MSSAYQSGGSHRPGTAVTAAVLGFVEAGLLLLSVVLAVAGLAATGLPVPGRDGSAIDAVRNVAIGSLLIALVWTAMLALGGLFLLRGSSRVLLLVVSWAEIALGVLLLGLAAVALTALSADTPAGGALQDVAPWTIAVGVVSLLLPVARVVLAHSASVRAWVSGRRRSGNRLVAAVLVPLGAVAAVGTVLVLTTDPSPGTVLAGGAAGGPGQAYQGESDWGRTYYRGGEPLPPPAAGEPLHEAGYDADARTCADGAMDACDDLYAVAPVGGLYEWYGASCAGRLDHESNGGCVAELGAIVD